MQERQFPLIESVASPAIGIVVCSDRASSGEYEDRSGPAIQHYFEERTNGDWQLFYRVISDDQPIIEQNLMELCDDRACSLVVTSGGTGPARRDVTPEATVAVCDTLLPGFGEVMRRISYRQVPTAILSRQTAGIRSRTLIVNLPGSPKAIAECLDAIIAAIPDCLSLIGALPLPIDREKVAVYNPHDDA